MNGNLETVAIDTNIAIDILNGKQYIIDFLKDFSSLSIPVTVIGELLYGAENSVKKDENLTKYKDFINSCIALNIEIAKMVYIYNFFYKKIIIKCILLLPQILNNNAFFF